MSAVAPATRAPTLATRSGHRLVLALAPLHDTAPLDRGELHALDLLLDLSCVVRMAEGVPSDAAVPLRIVGGRDTGSWTLAERDGLGIGVEDGAVVLERAALGLIHELAGAVAEQRSPARDRHGRVPSSANAMVLGGGAAERQPVVSMWARSLADAVARAAGRRPVRLLAPWPEGRRWAAALTHDLDVVEWWPLFTALRLVELARKGELALATRVIGAALRTRGRDVVWRGVHQILNTEAQCGVRSSWFVLCATPTLATARVGDLTYRPEGTPARRILAALREAGHEIGLHGSFATADDHGHFVAQRARLAALATDGIIGVRQHFLRMRPGSTQLAMRAAGFSYDSTFGFADRNGFRLGVADVVPMWSEEAQDVTLDEVPFAWMDRALSKYGGIEQPDRWIDDALDIAEECRAVQGLFAGIWHPNLTDALGYPGAPAAYERMVRELVARDAFIAPLGELVAWRRARRAVRAASVSPAGRVSLVAPGSIDARIRLENADGQAVEHDDAQ